MAEAIMNYKGRPTFTAYSAGSNPSGAVRPEAIGGVLRDLPAPLHGLPLPNRGHGPDLPDVLCHDRRADLAVAAGLQLQRRRVGRVYRTVWHRGRDRRRDGC